MNRADEEEGATLKLGGAAAQTFASELSVSVVDGPDRGREPTRSKGPSLIVGRAAGADLQLTDPAVSAFHLELTSVPRGIAVRDLKSQNGTFTPDGVCILHAVIPAASTLTLGTTTLRIDRVDDPRSNIPNPELSSFGRLRASSAIMRSLFAVLARIAPTELSILIEGATGTGKELVAHGIHHASTRAGGPFVVLDCTSIPRALAESVLFGHERGAFSGADVARAGVFEAAEGGTVFLDEIGDLPLDLQPKLLRVLERREVVRIGQNEPRPISVRVVSATWRDLRTMVNLGTFREDLYFRFAQARVCVPSLSNRLDDIPALAYHFLQTLPAEAPGARMIARDALDDLKRRPWPGNVRELRNTVERAAMLAQGTTITLADLGFERILSGEREHARAPGAALKAALSENTSADVPGASDESLPDFKDAKKSLVDEFERGYLVSLLAKSGDNLTRASTISGIERHHLRDLLRKHGLRGS